MDLDRVTQVLALLALLISIANAVWVWLSAGDRKLATEQSKLAKGQECLADDIDKLESRIQAIESELKHIPSKDDVMGLKLGLTKVEGKLGTFEAEMASVGRTVRRIDDHLRDRP